ncbi:MAG: hypothetical protein H0W34_12995 [Pyrinomonadaceae bacterium]|nr:hypothetical protein [Pyrinomonadaceae bacterium]
MTENFRRLYFMMLFALVFYVVGAGFVQSFVNYPTWKLIGAGGFKAYHHGMSPLIIKFMVLPWLVEILLTVLAAVASPARHPAPGGSFRTDPQSDSVHLDRHDSDSYSGPAQRYGAVVGVDDRLLATDPIRWTPGILRALLYLWMMSLVVRAVDSSSKRSADVSGLRVGEQLVEVT